MNALASMTQSNLPALAAGEVVTLPSVLLSGFDDLLGEVAAELLQQTPQLGQVPEHADSELALSETDGRHVFFAAQDALPRTPVASEPPLHATKLPAMVDDVAMQRSLPIAQPVQEEPPMDPWGLGDVATVEVDLQTREAVVPERAEYAKPVEASQEPSTSESQVEPASIETLSAVVEDLEATDPSGEQAEGDASAPVFAKVESSPSADAASSLDELVVDMEEVATPELSAELPADNTVRVQVDDDLAVEVTHVDGEVDVALLGADAVKPVMKTVEGELRDALKRGGYDLGQFDRDEHEAPRERRRRQGSKNPNTPERRAQSGVLL